MDSYRADILAQLAAGDISAEQAAERLRGGPRPIPPIPPVPPVPPVAPVAPIPPAALNRWLRIRVTDLESGRARVNVNVPLSWVALGLRLGAERAPELERLDLGELLAHLDSGASGQIVDVEDLDDGQRVQIYVD
jgi:hypothetical protein